MKIKNKGNGEVYDTDESYLNKRNRRCNFRIEGTAFGAMIIETTESFVGGYQSWFSKDVTDEYDILK